MIMATLRLSPLQLREHGFTTVRVHATDNGSLTNSPSLKPAISFERQSANPNQWRLVLSLELGSREAAKAFAYEGEMKVQGLVEVTGNVPEDRKEQLALVNGFSLLYSAAREMLLNITARSRHGGVTLPTISFVSMVKEATEPKTTPQNPAPAAAN
jgi:preprotein translocase subunit SecB